ncbi:hypothetical protein SK128_006674, partial [Halocaridina rubra]
MMKIQLNIVFVIIIFVTLASTGAKASVMHRRRHSRSRGHVAKLQDTVDQLLLRQETHHILLENIQKALQELQKERKPVSLTSSSVLASIEAEGVALSALGERMKEVRGTLTEALQAEERLDDMALLRQELNYL